MTDDDLAPNSDISYAITAGNADGKFAMLTTSNTITLAATLNADVTKQYALTVTATDGGTPARSATATVVVNVGYQNEHVPAFSVATHVGG